MILAILLGLFISHSLSAPIVKLRNVVVEIGKGKLDARVKIESKDEIGFLANSFNEMAQKLSASIEKEKELAAATAAADVEHKRALELDRAYKKLKEAQDILIQAEKLNAVGELASGVAHEVKNPLGIILQSIYYLEKALPLEPEVSELIKMMKDNIKRANDIVCDLVDFSRVTQLNIKPEDLNSVIETALVLVQHRLKMKDIEIIKNLKKDLPKIPIDKVRIEQVFVNVFLNAIQAMPDGGKLFIRSYTTQAKDPGKATGRRSEDYFELGETVVRIEVEDTGHGISEENLKRIFNPFFTTKGVSKGVGLGLSVSRNIIITHKGLIEVKSKEGKGTTIIIVLKIAGGA